MVLLLWYYTIIRSRSVFKNTKWGIAWNNAIYSFYRNKTNYDDVLINFIDQTIKEDLQIWIPLLFNIMFASFLHVNFNDFLNLQESCLKVFFSYQTKWAQKTENFTCIVHAVLKKNTLTRTLERIIKLEINVCKCIKFKREDNLNQPMVEIYIVVISCQKC